MNPFSHGTRDRRGYVGDMRAASVVNRTFRRRAWVHALRAIVTALALAILAPPAAASPRVVDAIVLVASHGSEASAATSTSRSSSRSRSRSSRSPAVRAYSRARASVATFIDACDPPSSFLTKRAPATRGERLYLLDCALLR